jgi:hypothetical protein
MEYAIISLLVGEEIFSWLFHALINLKSGTYKDRCAKVGKSFLLSYFNLYNDLEPNILLYKIKKDPEVCHRVPFFKYNISTILSLSF